MKLEIGLLALCIVLFGCTQEEIKIKDFLEVSVEGESITLLDGSFAVNENCDKIFISASNTRDNELRFNMYITLTTSGKVASVNFHDYADNNRAYKTPDFNAADVFSINEFTFSPDDRTLSVNFDGELFEINNSKATKRIAGEVRINHLIDVPCSRDPWQMEADINQAPFAAVNIAGSTDSEKSVWYALSNDGIKLSLITKQELKNMPVGVYPFNRNDMYNRVTLENYTGPYEATNSLTLSGENWDSYEYEGELIIEEHYIDKVEKTIGSFTLRALKGDEVVYEITNGRFSI